MVGPIVEEVVGGVSNLQVVRIIFVKSEGRLGAARPDIVERG